jgi:hypothetical protein
MARIPVQHWFAMDVKRCPRCNLIHPGSAMRCECGYSFLTGSFDAEKAKQLSRSRENAGTFIG